MGNKEDDTAKEEEEEEDDDGDGAAEDIAFLCPVLIAVLREKRKLYPSAATGESTRVFSVRPDVHNVNPGVVPARCR